MRHARAEDGFFTECGLPTVNWHVFWSLPYDSSHEEACLECTRSLGLAEGLQKPAAG